MLKEEFTDIHVFEFFVSVVSTSNSWTSPISTIKELSPNAIWENNGAHSCTQDAQYVKQHQPLVVNHVTHRPNGPAVHHVDSCCFRVGSVDLVWILHFCACFPFWKPNIFFQTSILHLCLSKCFLCIGEHGSIFYGPPFWIIVCGITAPSRFSWCSVILLPNHPLVCIPTSWFTPTGTGQSSWVLRICCCFTHLVMSLRG